MINTIQMDQMSHADRAKETATQQPTIKRMRIISSTMSLPIIYILLIKLERETRFELATSTLARLRSTS